MAGESSTTGEATAPVVTVNFDTASIVTALGEIKNSIDEQNTKLDSIKSTLNEIKASVDTSNTKIESVKSSIDTGNTKLQSVKTSIDTGNTKIESIKSSIDTGNTKIESVKNSIDSQKTELKSVLETIELDTAKLISRLINDKDFNFEYEEDEKYFVWNNDRGEILFSDPKSLFVGDKLYIDGGFKWLKALVTKVTGTFEFVNPYEEHPTPVTERFENVSVMPTRELINPATQETESVPYTLVDTEIVYIGNVAYKRFSYERSAAYYLASIVRLLKTSMDKNKMENEESEESQEDTNAAGREEQINAVDETIVDSLTSVLGTFVTFKYGVERQLRLKFQSEQDFIAHEEGQSFDFTRYFVKHWDVENTKATEFILLGASRTSNISTLAGADGLSRVTAWKDVKKVQTVVVIENTISNSCILYFPTTESVVSTESEIFVDEKKAIDSAVAKFQEILGDSYASVAVIPAESIVEQDILQTEYIEKAKLITPTYEYN